MTLGIFISIILKKLKYENDINITYVLFVDKSYYQIIIINIILYVRNCFYFILVILIIFKLIINYSKYCNNYLYIYG